MLSDGIYINTRDESHFEFEILPHSVQYLFIHSKPTIQYISVARITAVMTSLTDNILVTNQEAIYLTKTYTISSTGGSFRQSTLQGAGSRPLACSAIGTCIMGMMPKCINY
jgi:hypothetical protein